MKMAHWSCSRLCSLVHQGNQLPYHSKCNCEMDTSQRQIYLFYCSSDFSNILHFPVACKNIHFSSLFAAGEVSCGGMSATQGQEFHTDDIKSVQNPVKSADWSTK